MTNATENTEATEKKEEGSCTADKAAKEGSCSTDKAEGSCSDKKEGSCS
jgi:hypothetical protein